MIYCETPRLILREWREEDLPMFKAMNQDPKVMRYFPGLLNLYKFSVTQKPIAGGLLLSRARFFLGFRR